MKNPITLRRCTSCGTVSPTGFQGGKCNGCAKKIVKLAAKGGK
ncbi:MAG: hypothetical protein ACLQMG_02980 [Terracidiphilus sp.]